MAKLSTKRLMRISLFTAIALILSLFENALPPLLAFAPGAKMGLSNVVSLIALILLGVTDAYLILIVKCLLMAIFGGNVSSLMYSLPAGLISLSIQLILLKFTFKIFSLMGISFFGALIHNVVQLAVASLVTKTNLMPMLPFMLAAALVAGLFVGAVAFVVIKYLPKSTYADTVKTIIPPEIKPL